jgi:thiamine pyrophosphate-dependent acetolactate synthase large subunit-like protein
MAFEKEMIAAMNNPNTLKVIRWAQRYELDARYWMASADRWKERADEWRDTAERFEMNIRKGQKKLEAAQAENVAVHKDLGEAYESIRIRDERFLDDVGQYAQEAAHWKRVAMRNYFVALGFCVVTMITGWGLILSGLH